MLPELSINSVIGVDQISKEQRLDPTILSEPLTRRITCSARASFRHAKRQGDPSPHPRLGS